MTERQRVIAHKIAVQAAKNRLRQLSGIAVLELYGDHENRALSELYSAYTSSTYGYDYPPSGRLPYNSAREEIVSWLIEVMGLKEQREYFFLCPYGLWSRIKILDLDTAVSSLWEQSRDTSGFLLAEIDLSRVMDCGADSRDEDHYLADVWERRQGMNTGQS